MNVVVTGGTGHLGTPIVSRLLSDGSQVLSLSSQPQKIEWGQHPKLTHHIVDISKTSNLEIYFRQFVDENGPIDGLVVLTSRSPRGLNTEISAEKFSQNLLMTVEPTWQTFLEVRPFLNLGASVVLVSSLWAKRVPEPAMYLDLNNEPDLSVPAGKAAQRQLARYLAVDWAKYGIRVNLVTPGWFPKPGPIDRQDYINEITKRTPMGRIGRPIELVEPVIFFLGSGSSFMTGQELIVDGGFSLW